MSIIENYLTNIIIISCLNSFLVLLDNLIKTEGKEIKIENITIKEQLYLSSIFLSTILFVIDNIFLILIKKEKIIIEFIFIFLIFIIICKFKKIRKVL
jgi:hypothetical protein